MINIDELAREEMIGEIKSRYYLETLDDSDEFCDVLVECCETIRQLVLETSEVFNEKDYARSWALLNNALKQRAEKIFDYDDRANREDIDNELCG